MINFVRGLGHLDPVSFDAGYSAKAQQAALMMDANDDLDHDPPSSWDCWSQDGAEGAGSSNLCLGCSGPRAIETYMDDPGSSNTAAGHRRWIMRPETATMGSGSTSSANALWIFGADAPDAAVPQWVSWPTAGYFPSPLEPEGRWSLSASDPDVTFSGATVTVRDAAGDPLAVNVYEPVEGYGHNTLVWDVTGIEIPTDAGEAAYTVRVSNIKGSGTDASTFEYEVRLFSPPFSVETPPSISGETKVGETLTAGVGEWAPEPWDYAYRWFRSGVAIAGAVGPTYSLAPADLGETMTVEVTAEGPGYADTPSMSAASAIVERGDPLRATTRPVVYGVARVRATLTATTGDWTRAPDAYSYQWFRDQDPIAGAIGSTYSLTRKDKGRRISVRVVASKLGYGDGTATSTKTRRVRGRR